jgi:serine/threonine-protein kinase/endoribonuclease IRE1
MNLNISASEVQLDGNHVIGIGGKAVVFVGIFGNAQVAVKRVKLFNLNPKWDSAENCFDNLSIFHHDNVLKIFGIYEDKDFRYHIFERCIANLFDYGSNNYKGEIPNQVEGVYQMINGLSYIHDKGFVHGNLKPENILISPLIQFKISDFALTSDGGSYCQSTEMKAPEILKNNKTSHNVASDIFSLGCVQFYFLTKGCHPFFNKKKFLIPINMMNGVYNLSNLKNHFFADVVKNMIQKVPEKRINLKTLLNLFELFLHS